MLADILARVQKDRPHVLDRLIDHFGSPSAILQATPERLLAVAGSDGEDIAEFLIAAREFVDFALRFDALSADVRVDNPQLSHFLRFRIGSESRETLYAIFADVRGRFIKDEMLGVGAHSSHSSRIADILRRAVELHAGGLLLAHNHPSGSAKPSRADLKATARLRELADGLDIRLIDHLIVTRSTVYSMVRKRVIE
ncbi:MAG TPA: JAB domain-containing protein [Alteraurantiacibacter sp.]